MSTNAVNPAISSALSPAAGAGSAAGANPLNVNDFLTLLTAQLKNQDPLNPTSSSQFLSELAQLSTVSGISAMNTTLSNAMMSSQAVSGASLVGHHILAPGQVATYAAGSTLDGAVQVPAGASSVVLTISNASGQPVQQLSVPATAGLQSFSWDGKTAGGASAPNGIYSVSATAVVGNAAQSAPTLLQGSVLSVSLGSSGTTLNTPELGPVALTNVQQIS